MNGAESLVRTLHGAGVEVCFANPGTSEMQFVDALDRTNLMRCVLGLFEGVVTGAADGYARMAGKPAVTLLHLAPGLANAGANMHNARKARTPMLNLVGDHAVRHLAYDAPLTGDVAGAAAPFSDWVRTATHAASIAQDAADGLAAALSKPGRVATLIAPADIGWDEGGVVAAPVTPQAPRALDQGTLDAAAAALGPDTLILVGGAVLEDPATLALLAGIRERTGAALMAPTSNRRMERGAGRVNLPKIPYPVDMALKVLGRFRRAILIEAQAPVAFFAYPDRPSLLLPEGCEVVQLAHFDQDGPAAVAALAEACGARPHTPPDAQAPEAPGPGPITPDRLAAAITAALPEGAIVVDESITAGGGIFPMGAGAPAASWLSLTGGAIGIGPPLALGAAMACPDRPVVALQADGSAMYTIQALWTQAREGANVTTVLLANRGYEILKQELSRVGANPGPSALSMLEMAGPEVDFVSLARGMGVPGQRVECAAELFRVLRAAVDTPGPYLIEAAL
ncbi:MAG: acetolactate synthase large subunit [Alkalilacustris sp.]